MVFIIACLDIYLLNVAKTNLLTRLLLSPPSYIKCDNVKKFI